MAGKLGLHVLQPVAVAQDLHHLALVHAGDLNSRDQRPGVFRNSAAPVGCDRVVIRDGQDGQLHFLSPAQKRLHAVGPVRTTGMGVQINHELRSYAFSISSTGMKM